MYGSYKVKYIYMCILYIYMCILYIYIHTCIIIYVYVLYILGTLLVSSLIEYLVNIFFPCFTFCIISQLACMLSHFSWLLLFVTVWTVARQAPLFMGFSWQESNAIYIGYIVHFVNHLWFQTLMMCSKQYCYHLNPFTSWAMETDL